jgi:type II secretory pathway component PulM
LTNFQGGKNNKYDNNNEATFIKYSTQEWSISLSRIDSIQKEMETALKNADKKQLMKWDIEINNMCSHMAYHTGQIVYIQKMKGWWVETKTVK